MVVVVVMIVVLVVLVVVVMVVLLGIDGDDGSVVGGDGGWVGCGGDDDYGGYVGRWCWYIFVNTGSAPVWILCQIIGM